MKHKARTKAMSWLLSLALALSLVPGMGLTAQAALPDKVYYRVYDYSDSKLTYTDYEIAGTGATEVTSDTTEWANGTYVVSATTTISSRITVTGTVNLIIFDGATLTAAKGITVSDGNTLNIYMGNSSNSIQSTGQLNATALQDNLRDADTHERKGCWGAGIGGYCERSMEPGGTENYEKSGCGNVNIHGGSIRVQYVDGNDNVAGIGGSLNGAGGNITIYYGSVTAYSYQYVSAIGAGYNGSGGNIAVYGGEVNAIVAATTSNSTKNGFGGTLTVGKDVQVYALQGSKSPTEDLSGQTNVAPEGGGQVTTFDNSMFTRYTGPAPVSSHEHNFTYSASGDTITATCGADGCPLTGSKATLTIAAPLHTAVGDGKSADAQITDANSIRNNAAVQYFNVDTSNNKTGDALTSAPTAAGTYWAEITLTNGGSGANDSATAHVVYTITDLAYTVTISDNLVGGTVAADKTSAKYDETVTLTITPDNGFTIKTVKYNDTAITANGGVYSFTMPAANVTVSAEFEGAPYNLTISNEITGGTVTASSDGLTDNGTKAKAGSEVTLTVTPATGYQIGTVKYNETTITPSEGVYKFTMPAAAVTVTATFVGKPVTVTLNPTGDGGTASLLHDDYTAVTNEKPLTKKAGEKFILLVNRDDEYDFNVKCGTSDVSMTEFTEDEYKNYIAYANKNNISVSTNTVLAWVTMPGAEDGSVTLTVNFSKLQTFTVLYQPSDSSTTAVWCKFAVYSGVDGNNTDSAQMKSDATMGDGSKVYSLKVTAGFAPNQVDFATSSDGFGSDTMKGITAKEAAPTQESDWTPVTGGKAVIIGGDAKTVIVAFVADADAMKAYKDNAVDAATATGGVEYRVAVVTGGNAGTVTAPANTLTKEGYDFAGWRGFEGTAPNKTEKIYNAGNSISVSENTTLNAVWNLKKSTVTLNLNGGTGNSSVDPVTYGEKLPTLVNPTRSGFAFDGWTASNTVTEDGTLFAKGSLFDLNTKITADLGLTAQWKHVHSYSCYQISAFGDRLAKYQKYEKALHIAVCGCNDIQLMAHEFDSSGKCACGYQKPGAQDVTLNISYGQWSSGTGTYTEKMQGMPETTKQGQEISIYAPNTWGSLQFSKWQYSAGDGQWADLTADAYASFLIPATMTVRALYVNPVTEPQVELSARKYDDQTVVNGQTYTMDNILFQMNYKLPDGYTFVDAGIRLGDNAGISYYELKERTITTDAGGKAMLIGAAAVMNFLGNVTTVDLSATDTYYEEHTRSVLTELSAATLAKYMYESKPINVEKYDPIYWEAKAVTKGMSGSMATLPPLRFAQKDNQNHWIYGIGWLRYKDSSGNIKTIYTDALAATVKNIPGTTVTNSGS